MPSDIRIDFGFFDHRKTKKLIARLGLIGVWSLLKLWRKAAENRQKGILYDMTEEDIALDAEWPDDASLFCSTLVDIKWMEMNEGVYCLHDWQEHQPWIFHSDVRSTQAREAVKIRWEKRKKKATNKKSIRDVYEPYTDPNTPSPIPYPFPSPSPTPKPSHTHIPPQIEWVIDYCKERNKGVDPHVWYDHYQANGWKVGKAATPMKDWQAAIRTWEKNDNRRDKFLGGLSY